MTSCLAILSCFNLPIYSTTNGLCLGLVSSDPSCGALNFEYPANPKIEPGDELQSWGSFREDTLPIIKIAELAPEAQKIIDRVGW